MRDLDGIAVTAAPGLVGALLVGVMYGKTLAWRLDLPLIGVHHLEGHLFAATLEDPTVSPPFVALLVSGGHTMLLDVPGVGPVPPAGPDDRRRGRRSIRQGGEAARASAIPAARTSSAWRARARPGRFRFPRPMLREMDRPGAQQYAFSFSGLKTAVLRAVQQSTDLDARSRRPRPRVPGRGTRRAGGEDGARERTRWATSTVVIGGGVACNRALAERMRARVAPARVAVASPRLNTDNAAMIAAAGAWRLERGERSGWDLEPRDTLPLPGLIVSTPAETTA